MLEKGMTGPEVVELQKILTAQGFYRGPITGQFDDLVEDSVIYFQQTHKDSGGQFLLPDGIVGPKTQWALTHPSGDSQRSFLKPAIPTGIVGDRAKILSVAIAEHAKNVREIPDGSNRGPEVDKYFPQWVLNQVGKGPGLHWCCFFVNWVVRQALGVYPWHLLIGGCYELMSRAKALGMWYEAGSQRMRPGDIFIIIRPRVPGKPIAGHTGVLLAVDGTDSEFNTIEGNCGNRVACGRRRTDAMKGFINPYGDSAQTVEFDHVLLGSSDTSQSTTT